MAIMPPAVRAHGTFALLYMLSIMETFGQVVQHQESGYDTTRYHVERRDGSWFLNEMHSDGLAIHRRGVVDSGISDVVLQPYVAGTFRRLPRDRVLFEWRVCNCDIGDAGWGGDHYYSVAHLGGKSLGECRSPLCRVELDDFGERVSIDVSLMLVSAGREPFATQHGIKIVLPRALEGDRMRMQSSLAAPLASSMGDIYIADVVYSQVSHEIFVFGPSSRPLGGLFCEWDKNPQTCQEGCNATLKCHADRIPLEIRRSWVWADAQKHEKYHHPGHDHGDVRYQCVFGSASGETVVQARVPGDAAGSHNLAGCNPPEEVRSWLLGDVPNGDETAAPLFEFESVDSRTGAVISSVALPLSPHVASKTREKTYIVSACAIFRDQAPYLAEWVEYHLMLGVDHFYLYDHRSVDMPSLELLPYVERGVVDLHQWDLTGHPQKEAMMHCTHKYGHETMWMVMMDVDEFLVPGINTTFKQALNDVDDGEDRDVMYIQQIFYGHQGYDTSPGGLVIENYLNRSSNFSLFSYRTKYIFNPTSGRIVIPCIHNISHGVFVGQVLSESLLRINHYTVKSRSHWESDHIKRYQPMPDEWNEESDDYITSMFLDELKLRMCRQWGKVYHGPSVVPLPEGATCEEATLALDRSASSMLQGGHKLAAALRPSDATHHVQQAVKLRFLTPLEGTTVLTVHLNFAVDGVEGGWESCCFVDVFFNGEVPGVMNHMHRVTSPSELPLIMDRDRVSHPYGPSWHTIVLHLHRLHEVDAIELSAPIAKATARIRLTGARKILGGVGAEVGANQAQVARRGFPVAYPSVCAAFMSCGRLELLRKGMRALVEHMEGHEPGVEYEIAWVDNDSGSQALEVYREFMIERTALYRVNYGATHGLNTLLFELCRRSRYVITLEEDWEWDASRTSIPAVEMAIEVINHDAKVMGVILRADLDYNVDTSEWKRTKGPMGVEYRLRCPKGGTYGYGAWTNGAAVWDRDLLEAEVGRQDEGWGDGAELEYSQRVGAKYCSAMMRIGAGCEDSACNAVVNHIGEDHAGNLVRSKGWETHVGGFD